PRPHVRRLHPLPGQWLHELGRHALCDGESAPRPPDGPGCPDEAAPGKLPPLDPVVACAQLQALRVSARLLPLAEPPPPSRQYGARVRVRLDAFRREALDDGGHQPLLRNPSHARRVGRVDRRAERRALRLLLSPRADHVSPVPGSEATSVARRHARRLRPFGGLQARGGRLSSDAPRNRCLPPPRPPSRGPRREDPVLRGLARVRISDAEGADPGRGDRQPLEPLRTPPHRLEGDPALPGKAARARPSLRDLSLSRRVGKRTRRRVLRRVRGRPRPDSGSDLPLSPEPAGALRPRVLLHQHRARAPIPHRRWRGDRGTLYLHSLYRPLL